MTDHLDRLFARQAAQAEARMFPCPTCLAHASSPCVGSQTHQETAFVHAARYAYAGVDGSVDVYQLHDDALRGYAAGARAVAAASWSNHLIVSGDKVGRDLLLQVVPVEYRNGRELHDCAPVVHEAAARLAAHLAGVSVDAELVGRLTVALAEVVR